MSPATMSGHTANGPSKPCIQILGLSFFSVGVKRLNFTFIYVRGLEREEHILCAFYKGHCCGAKGGTNLPLP
jgi:hypothetical protein